MGSMNNIFDVLCEKVGIGERLETIDRLFSSVKCVTLDWRSSYGNTYDMPIEALVDGPLYLKWPYRNGTSSAQRLRKLLEITTLSEIKDDPKKTCYYLEYVYNMTGFVYDNIKDTGASFNLGVFASIIRDLEDAAGALGMEFTNQVAGRHILCVSDAPVMEAAAVADPDEMATLVDYLHFASKGDIERKSDYLARLYKGYEARLMKLDGPEFKNLRDDIGMLANSLNTRHNNRDGKNSKEAFRSMSESELEMWYDYLVGLFAEAILAERRVDKKEQVKSLRGSLSR